MGGRARSATSAAVPMTRTLQIVPTPGFWRSGIQISSTRAPTRLTIMPRLSPVSCDKP
ncbi:hypothetical protein D3C81_1940930 [compost metagenome]